MCIEVLSLVLNVQIERSEQSIEEAHKVNQSAF